MDWAREDLSKSLKRRKEIAIAKNDTQYKEINTTKLFANGDSNKSDATIIELVCEEHRIEKVTKLIHLMIKNQGHCVDLIFNQAIQFHSQDLC